MDTTMLEWLKTKHTFNAIHVEFFCAWILAIYPETDLQNFMSKFKNNKHFFRSYSFISSLFRTFEICRTYYHYPKKVLTLVFWNNSCVPEGHYCPLNFIKIILLEKGNLLTKEGCINVAQISKLSSKLILNTFNQLTKKC